MTRATSHIIKGRTLIVIPVLAAVLAAMALLPAVAGAANPHDHRFTVVAHNDEGTITPADFFDNLVQNSRASVDAPLYLDGGAVGGARGILVLTVTDPARPMLAFHFTTK